MVVGVLQLELAVPEAMSLKDKRRVIKSLKDRLGGRHNVSIAEVGDLDEHRLCRLAVAMVSNDRRFTDSCLSKIVDEIRMARGVSLMDYELEMFEFMAYRMQRMASVIREVVSDCVSNRLSDPRLARFISVTRVEMTPDLLVANVYLSVMGTDAEARTSMKGIASARGLIQTRLARQLDVRQCPELRFHLDEGLKIGSRTLRQLTELGPTGAAGDGPGDSLAGPAMSDDSDVNGAPDDAEAADPDRARGSDA